MNKHTPGPWKVRFLSKSGTDTGDNDFFVEAKNNNMPELNYGIEILMDDYGNHNGYPRSQRIADAKLIAGAPDMLHALTSFVETIDALCGGKIPHANPTDYLSIKDSVMYLQAIEAIKKATL